MDKTNVMVEFIMSGDKLDSNGVTEKLKIKPSKSWKKGEDIEGRKIKRIDNCWIINTNYKETYDINEQLFKIVKLLKDKKNILKELTNVYELEYFFEIVINVENNETPAIYFNKEFIKFTNDIEAEFEIDMYIYS
ncbi:MAG: hypothetical protein K0R54_5185 [Clostridiaceae bacterium]|nr:hypothetical protein [Clostridiaceae bacterium]